MSVSSSGKARPFRRADWFVGVLAVLAGFVLHASTDLVGTRERRFDDVASTSSARQPSGRIAIIGSTNRASATPAGGPGRSDSYSLGVTLYQMLTGVLPFRGDSMAELMYRIANAEAPGLLQVRPDLPPQLAEVVARALVKQPELRYQDGAALARELRDVIALLSGRPPAPAPAPAMQDTVVMSATPVRLPGPADATLPMPRAALRPVQAGNRADAQGVPASALPGYDARQGDRLRRQPPSGPGTAMNNTSGAPQLPQAGGGQAGQEP